MLNLWCSNQLKAVSKEHRKLPITVFNFVYEKNMSLFVFFASQCRLFMSFAARQLVVFFGKV